MADELTSIDVNSSIAGLSSLGYGLLFPLLIVAVIIMLIIVFVRGNITLPIGKKKYKTYIVRMQNNVVDFIGERYATYKTTDKMELTISAGTNVLVNSPPQEWISSLGNMFFKKIGEKVYEPIPPPELKRDADGKINIIVNPSDAPISKFTYAANIRKSYDRFYRQGFLDKYFPLLSILIGFIIIAIAFYLSMNSVAASMNGVAAQYSGVANKLADAQVVIVKNPKDEDKKDNPFADIIPTG